MITKLTDKQLELMQEIKQKWLDKLFKERKEIDIESFIPKAKWLYKFVGVKKEPIVLVLDSPMATQIAGNMLYGDGVESQVRSQVWSQVESQNLSFLNIGIG